MEFSEIRLYIFIFLVTFVSILYVKLNLEDKLISLLGSNKTSQEDYFKAIINIKSGAWIRAYLSEEKIIYMGKLKYYEDKENKDNRKIALTLFSSYSYDGDKLENNEDDYGSLILLSMKDIKCIEIFS